MPNSDVFNNLQQKTDAAFNALPVSQGNGANFPNKIKIVPSIAYGITTTYKQAFPFRSIFKTEAEKAYMNLASSVSLTVYGTNISGVYDYPVGAVNEGYRNAHIENQAYNIAWDNARGVRIAIDTLDLQQLTGLEYGQAMAPMPVYFTDNDYINGVAKNIPTAVAKKMTALMQEYVSTTLNYDMSVYTASTLASQAGTTVTDQDLTTTDEVLSALQACVNTFDENGVPTDRRILYITPTLYNLARGGNLLTNQRVFDSFSEIVMVPQNLMYTLAEKATVDGQAIGAYQPSANSKEINFLAVDKHATLVAAEFMNFAYDRFNSNVAADAISFRVLTIAHVIKGKKSGVYVSTSSTTATRRAGRANAEVLNQIGEQDDKAKKGGK